jgi:hypothetical protein
MLNTVNTTADDNAQRSMTLMLVVASMFSLVVNIPQLVSWAIDSWRTSNSYDVLIFFSWAQSIIAPWNYCGNFFFYVLSGKQFRRELIRMILCCCKRSGKQR